MVATLLFAIQIYCDFSGYSDIAVGCAKLFGINLTENFNKPYKSKSIKEFWGRWHISLSRWLRDYVYIPLGGNRKSKIRWVLNIIIVFFISGLWHGANYTFIVWGLLHALFQIIGTFTLKPRNALWVKMKKDPNGKLVSVLRTIGTFLLVDFCWIFFRANSIGDAGLAIAKIFTNWSFSSDYFISSFDMLGIDWKLLTIVLLSIAGLILIEYIKRIDFSKIKPFSFESVRFITYTVATALIVVSWIYLQESEVGSSFIYFQF